MMAIILSAFQCKDVGQECKAFGDEGLQVPITASTNGKVSDSDFTCGSGTCVAFPDQMAYCTRRCGADAECLDDDFICWKRFDEVEGEARAWLNVGLGYCVRATDVSTR